MKTKKWTCKICRTSYQHTDMKTLTKQQKEEIKNFHYQWPTTNKTCLNCGISQAENKRLWVCSRCYTVNKIDETIRIKNKNTAETCSKPGCLNRRRLKVSNLTLLTREQIIQAINKVKEKKCIGNTKGFTWIEDKEKTIEYKAFIALLYLTGSRVSELLFFQPEIGQEDKQTDNRPLPGIRNENIQEERHNKTNFLIVNNIITLKKNPDKNHELMRNVPINIDIEPIELTKPIIELLELKKKPQEILFYFKRERARQIIRKYFGKGIYPHMLRHARGTHLHTIYGFDIIQIQEFFHHSSTDVSKQYVHTGLKNLMDNMSKKAS